MKRRYIPFDVASIPYLLPVMRNSLPLFFSLLTALPEVFSALFTFHAVTIADLLQLLSAFGEPC